MIRWLVLLVVVCIVLGWLMLLKASQTPREERGERRAYGILGLLAMVAAFFAGREAWRRYKDEHRDNSGTQ